MPWSIYQWLDGTNAFDSPITDLEHAAVSLGRFGAALRKIDDTNGPPSFRGKPLALQEADVLAAINDLGAAGTIDKARSLDAWEKIISLPQWNDAPVWTHGDLLPGNLLVVDGRDQCRHRLRHRWGGRPGLRHDGGLDSAGRRRT